MSPLVKILVGLALVLPMTGYVVGSLVASSEREPDRREPVIVSNVQDDEDLVDLPGPTPRDRPSSRPGQDRDDAGDDAPAEDDPAEDVEERDVDENGITVVRPEPTRPENDADDDADDRGGDDDGDDRDDRDERTDTDERGDD